MEYHCRKYSPINNISHKSDNASFSFGVPVDLDPIMDLASEYNIAVIDDSAETVCGQYKGEWAGIKADCSVYSFENKKHISSGSEEEWS